MSLLLHFAANILKYPLLQIKTFPLKCYCTVNALGFIADPRGYWHNAGSEMAPTPRLFRIKRHCIVYVPGKVAQHAALQIVPQNLTPELVRL